MEIREGEKGRQEKKGHYSWLVMWLCPFRLKWAEVKYLFKRQDTRSLWKEWEIKKKKNIL